MKFIELFAGIGGFRYGLEACNGQQQTDATFSGCGNSIGNQIKQPDESEKRGNYACVYSNDIDKYASAIYRYHWNDGTMHEGDIRATDASGIPEHDLICAGFPCQSFSIAGKRGGFADTRGTLFFEICRIARAKGTKHLFLENVRGLLSHDEGNTFQTIIGTLDDLGYDCQWQVLNSKNHGVPQNRERVFIIGHLRRECRPQVFPIGETVGINNEQDLKFIGGIMGEQNKKWLENGKEFSRNFPQGQRVYSPEGISAQLTAQGGGWGAKTGLYEIPMIAQSLQTDGQLRSGTSWGTDKPQSSRNIRRLTPIECERLQGFPDNWTNHGITKDGKQVTISDTQRYKCCGNAVTTNVITDIGKELARAVTST
jgi:DNA (cytosine-5)-methyltransferase 1